MKENGAVTAREPNRPDDAWVVDVLHAEQLELIDERRIQHYGKRALSRSTNLVLWAQLRGADDVDHRRPALDWLPPMTLGRNARDADKLNCWIVADSVGREKERGHRLECGRKLPKGYLRAAG
jgi:hypothetical protein